MSVVFLVLIPPYFLMQGLLTNLEVSELQVLPISASSELVL